MRLAILFGFALLGFLLGRDRIRLPPVSGVLASASTTALLLMALALMLLVGTISESTALAVYWRRSAIDILQIDAAVAGFTIGFILGDHGRLRTTALGGLALGLSLIGMTIVAAVPPGSWERLAASVQSLGFSEKGFQVSFAPGGGSGGTLGRVIRAAAPPTTLQTGNGRQDLIGFPDARIDQLRALTFPSMAAESRRAELDPKAYDSFARDMVFRPAPSANDRSLQASVHLIDRDRATLWLLRDSTEPEFEKTLPRLLTGFAASQEGLLRSLAADVDCLTAVVGRSGDRRLVQFRNFEIVEHIYIIAQNWMFVERERTRQTLLGMRPTQRFVEIVSTTTPTPQSGPQLFRTRDATDDALVTINERLDLLSAKLVTFREWAVEFVKLRGSRPERDLADVQKACAPDPAADPSARNNRPIADPTAAIQGGASLYAPYMSIFAAHLLAAIGDHTAAIFLLRDWLTGLGDLEKTLGKRSVFYDRMVAWSRLRVEAQIYLIQYLSETAENAVPVRPEFLRHLVYRSFPSVLSENVLASWTKGTLDVCRRPEAVWRQPIILS
jgi:hypothetical protein